MSVRTLVCLVTLGFAVPVLAQEAAAPFNLPVMIHMGQTGSPLPQILDLLKGLVEIFEHAVQVHGALLKIREELDQLLDRAVEETHVGGEG